MSSLHDQIMNLRGNVGMDATVYKIGHRDARHAAAELAIVVEQQRDELLAALKACESALRLVERETGKSYAATINARAAIAKTEAKP